MRDDNSFTFKVNALPETTDGEPEKKWSPFTDVKKGKVILSSVYSFFRKEGFMQCGLVRKKGWIFKNYL